MQFSAGFDHLWRQRQPRQRDDDGADGSCNRKRNTAGGATGKWHDCAGCVVCGSGAVRWGTLAEEAYVATVLAGAERRFVGRRVRGDVGVQLLAYGDFYTDSGWQLDGPGGGQRSVRILGEHEYYADCAIR